LFAIRAYYRSEAKVRMTMNLTVATLLAEGVRRLRAFAAGTAPGATPELDAQVLLAHVLGVPRVRLRSHPESLPEPEGTRRYRALLERRAAGEPVAYLTGEKDFWTLRLQVTSAVLIPRPETEHVIKVALDRLGGRKDLPLSIADVGTGSGCIAVALAHELSRAAIFATDISPAALEIARRNAARHGVADRIHFMEGDLLQPVRSLLPPRQFLDMVVSNPPYIGREEQPQLPREVREHEPHTALFAGPTGVELYSRLIAETEEVLGENGIIVLELGHNSLQHVQSIFNASIAWSGFVVQDDLAGIARVISALRRAAC
jgi:release factor glutamine methyltransferase